MIVLQETSYSEQDYMHLFPTFIFFYYHFGSVLIPFPKALPLFKIRKEERKLRFVHSVI